MNKLRLLLFWIFASIAAQAQEEQRILDLVNQERSKPALIYLKDQQQQLTSVAKQLPGRYGHYYGGPYDGEVLTRCEELDNAVKMFWNSPRHRAVLNSRTAKYATVGIFKNEFAYYVIIRTYKKKP